MWKGWIIEESLSDTKILSSVKITNTVLEENSEGGKKLVWKIHTAEVDDGKMDSIARELEEVIKPAWYAHFTDGKNLTVIFHGRSFRMKLEKVGKEKDTGITDFVAKEKKVWRAAFAYGTGKGKVDARYMLKVE